MSLVPCHYWLRRYRSMLPAPSARDSAGKEGGAGEASSPEKGEEVRVSVQSSCGILREVVFRRL
ncbi:hypothetical protein MUK42_35062 [Musa troglodytarum]|uniref:Uncharacterized protein n=1 Tax=Musa troglodytarum TaxID=320322 RepID=A0A9E7JBN0_9LILI|nr:hypothetical protein MUK42_35062 [Musa troglodytarum]